LAAGEVRMQMIRSRVRRIENCGGDEGVKEMIRLAVEGCRRNHIHSGLCGQAPSDYPDMAEYLVELGIESMSLNPDTVLKTTRQVLEAEKRLGRAARSSHDVEGVVATAQGAAPRVEAR
jgi:phosphoenolpyruvate-protein kinase (PTS system EI component)